MYKYNSDNFGDRGGTVLLQTFTQPADKANFFATKMSEEFLKRRETVSIGAFYPVVLNGELHYTFTITGSNLV